MLMMLQRDMICAMILLFRYDADEALICAIIAAADADMMQNSDIFADDDALPPLCHAATIRRC